MDNKRKVKSIASSDMKEKVIRKTSDVYDSGKQKLASVKNSRSNKSKKSNSEINSFKDILFHTGLRYVVFAMIGIIILVAFLSFISNALGNRSFKVNNEGISAGISKVYDATVYVEGYSDNSLDSYGTGFVYKKAKGKGYILTNYHIVSNSTSIKIIFSDSSESQAKLMGGDPYMDVAVLSVSSKDVKDVASIGNSSKATLGDTVFTVGSLSSRDYRGTVTRGIISGKDRLVNVTTGNSNGDYAMKLLQTDAVMDSGNNGGPLCNVKGEVIGMNASSLVHNNSSSMGFAIPIEDIMSQAANFEDNGTVSKPYIGIEMVNLEDTYAIDYYELSDYVNTRLKQGVVVESINSNSSAQGKLRKGDIITKLNKEDVNNTTDLKYQLYKHKPGDKIKLTIDRNGKKKNISIILDSKN